MLSLIQWYDSVISKSSSDSVVTSFDVHSFVCVCMRVFSAAWPARNEVVALLPVRVQKHSITAKRIFLCLLFSSYQCSVFVPRKPFICLLSLQFSSSFRNWLHKWNHREIYKPFGDWLFSLVVMPSRPVQGWMCQ